MSAQTWCPHVGGFGPPWSCKTCASEQLPAASAKQLFDGLGKLGAAMLEASLSFASFGEFKPERHYDAGEDVAALWARAEIANISERARRMVQR